MKIKIDHLSKIYKNGNKAVNDVTLDIDSGMFGLLGPNGAGKTTLMRILATLMTASSGDVKINDLDILNDRGAIRSMLGFLPQDFSSFPKLKTWEFLDYSAALAGIKLKKERMHLVDAMLDKVGLLEFRDRQAKKLSGGMKRRLGIAQALIGDPKILIVDEPTTGLDPEERIRFRNILSDMSRKEIVIILSTHIVGDISSTCKKMALLNKGSVAFNGTPDELIDLAREHVFRIEAFDSDLENIKANYPVISTIPSENGWDVEVVANKLGDYKGEIIEPNLEHAYMYFMEYLVEDETVKVY
ncbi:MAG: ABC transporter ATP-binding protein [Melioribacteraceae bacterium]|nr:ABC transporter ATP-binding protein [Melioribacteraceae bacterium]